MACFGTRRRNSMERPTIFGRSSIAPTRLVWASYSTWSTTTSARPEITRVKFSAHYTSNKHHTEWGDAINFDSDDSRPVREFVAENAAYWVREFHLDGLRLDATQAIVDDSVGSHRRQVDAGSASGRGRPIDRRLQRR